MKVLPTDLISIYGFLELPRYGFRASVGVFYPNENAQVSLTKLEKYYWVGWTKANGLTL